MDLLLLKKVIFIITWRELLLIENLISRHLKDSDRKPHHWALGLYLICLPNPKSWTPGM